MISWGSVLFLAASHNRVLVAGREGLSFTVPKGSCSSHHCYTAKYNSNGLHLKVYVVNDTLLQCITVYQYIISNSRLKVTWCNAAVSSSFPNAGLVFCIQANMIVT